eukprot:7862003-Alexandrium_andersonii.AAC.1
MDDWRRIRRRRGWGQPAFLEVGYDNGWPRVVQRRAPLLADLHQTRDDAAQDVVELPAFIV